MHHRVWGKWPSYLPNAVFSYNVTRNSATTYSPFQMKELRTPPPLWNLQPLSLADVLVRINVTTALMSVIAQFNFDL